ncbi:hypothetical protein L1D31_18065 [Vibrio sp. Isolate23]|uniref:hypothetical protein n=1 Tax=Vibrio sp. Isolate23 TaxID=2908533 RepID=UPI001EFC7E1F|nr:hypothetical protein [Vibrio sp. Isolate23]MCG9684444.1 hypothetical protein [Vibrio sp. Isolate23]
MLLDDGGRDGHRFKGGIIIAIGCDGDINVVMLSMVDDGLCWGYVDVVNEVAFTDMEAVLVDNALGSARYAARQQKDGANPTFYCSVKKNCHVVSLK